MRRTIKIASAICALSAMLFVSGATVEARGGGGKGGGKGGTVNVRPYTKKDGTYVTPHHRTAPDKSKDNNWGTKGNTNPYTGKPGTKQP